MSSKEYTFKNSLKNPTSRASRVLNYLSTHGPATKAEILRDVFGVIIVDESWVRNILNTNIPNHHDNTKYKSHSWGSGFFSALKKKGLVTSERVGNKIVYSTVTGS